LIGGATGDGAAAPTFARATKEDDAMADEKKQSGPDSGGGGAKPANKAHSGGKPGAAGEIGETDVAPEHDPESEKSGRREFGRDG
jgi:hypothetical protein